MRVFWERTGVLGPIYRLAGQGLSDVDIANKLNLTELKVQGCVAWILHFLKLTDRSNSYGTLRFGQPTKPGAVLRAPDFGNRTSRSRR